MAPSQTTRATTYLTQYRGAEAMTFFIASILYALFAGFKTYKRRNMLHSSLLLPASNANKFWSEVVCTTMIAPAILLLVMIVADFVVVQTSHINDFYSFPLCDLSDVKFEVYYFFLIIAALCSLRHTRLTWVGVLIFIASIIALVVVIQHGDDWYPYFGHTFTWHSYNTYGGFIRFDQYWIKSQALRTILSTLWLASAPIAIYVWSYLKFKEREL